MMFWLIILIAFTWLGHETRWLTIRLPSGSLQCPTKPVEVVTGTESSAWQDELPYDIGYLDTDFEDDNGIPDSIESYIIDKIWEPGNEPDYQAWLRKHYAPKNLTLQETLSRPERVPSSGLLRDKVYEWQEEREQLGMRQRGEMIYQRGTLKVRS